jgi:phosphatidylserine decarboxylase
MIKERLDPMRRPDGGGHKRPLKTPFPGTHQFIRRSTGQVVTERLLADRLLQWLYSQARESTPRLFSQLTSRRVNDGCAFWQFDFPARRTPGAVSRLIRKLAIPLAECLAPETLTSPRRLFERQIRFWHFRPMSARPDHIVSPADARMVVGSFEHQSLLFLKEKFFDYEELLGSDKHQWRHTFQEGQFAIFRLTPEKYHYNHLPVSGRVVDIYEIQGAYHSCNPGAVVRMVTPYSKNCRVVTIIDTSVPGGSGIGYVAMIEIVALMIGDIVQCYSDRRYEAPRPVVPGMFLKRGQPKSLYRPGSSVDVLIFQKDRVRFCRDILANQHHTSARSRFSAAFGQPLVETDVQVRATIAVKGTSDGR